MSDITMQEFEKLIEEAYQLKSEKDEVEKQLEAVAEKLRHKQMQIMVVMQEMEKDSYKSKWGVIVRQKRFTVKTPKDPDSKRAFFEYLESKGIREQMTSVNSQTLNSWYKSELELAKESGKEASFSIPGLDEPTYSEFLTMRS